MLWAWRAAVSVTPRLMTTISSRPQPQLRGRATHPAMRARDLLCNVVPHSVVLRWPCVKRLDCRVRLSAGALAMLAARPATGPALALFQLLLGAANATLSSHVLLGILDPADEFVARQGRDVLPRSQHLGVGDQRLAQVCRQLVHPPAGHSLAAHRARLTRDVQ